MSGAGLAWKFFHGVKAMPPLVQYVQDRDLWKFEFWESKAINAYIAVRERDFDSWTFLHRQMEESLQEVKTIGSYLLAQHQKICEELIENAAPISIEDSEGNYHEGLQCNCTPQFASEVGHLLALRSKSFGSTWFTKADGSVQWSLRSNGDFDVSKIAKSFGGGGHKNAAGFVLAGPAVGNSSAGIKLWCVREGEI